MCSVHALNCPALPWVGCVGQTPVQCRQTPTTKAHHLAVEHMNMSDDDEPDASNGVRIRIAREVRGR